MNKKILSIIIGSLAITLVSWNVFLLVKNKKLEKKLFEVQENFHYLNSYNEVLKYDLTIARDSSRILKEQIQANENMQISKQQ